VRKNVTSIELVVHLEKVDDPEVRFVWWAESPDLDGFYSAANYLSDLLEQAKTALSELCESSQVEIILANTSSDAVGGDGDKSAIPNPSPYTEIESYQTRAETSLLISTH
jgi:hypothetical protein